MQTGTRISAIGHGALIVLAVFGLPWFGPREREPIRVTEVSFVSEAEFEAAQAAAPAEAPRARTRRRAAGARRRRRPSRRRQPEPAPSRSPRSRRRRPRRRSRRSRRWSRRRRPSPPRIVPRVVTLEPPTAAAPPRARPAPRVEPDPTPPPEEALRPAEVPEPVRAPEPERRGRRGPRRRRPRRPRRRRSPSAEAAPQAPLALETSARPLARPSGSVAPRHDEAETVMAALRREVERRGARSATPSADAEPTPRRPTPTATPRRPSRPRATATSLPVGPPMTNSEKDGLKLAVQRCWNVPAGLRDAQELKVTLAAELAADGAVINASIRMIEPSPAPDARFQQAYEAGRRALIRCSPYADLPRDKYAQWRNIEVVFNPEGMVSW